MPLASLGLTGPAIPAGNSRATRTPLGPAPRGADPAREAGSVTVELALALPAVVALMVIVLAVGSAAIGQIAVVGGARAGARAAALGQSDAEIEAAAVAAAGGGAGVSVSRGSGLVRVSCERQVAVPPFGYRIAAASAVAVCEPARGCG